MITEIDVVRTLTKLLQNNFPKVSVNDRDQKEGFNRPSFFVYPASMKDGAIGTFLESSDLYIIDYFAPQKDIGFLDLLQTKVILSQLLNKAVIINAEETEDGAFEHFHLTFDDVSFTMNHEDKTLETAFYITLVQKPDETDSVELMTDLVVTLTKKESE